MLGRNISKPDSLFPTDLFGFGKSGREKNLQLTQLGSKIFPLSVKIPTFFNKNTSS